MENDHNCVGNGITGDNFLYNLNFVRYYYCRIIIEVGENIT